MKKILRAVDLFCGAGGTSTGLARACVSAGVELDLLAINHWTVAIKTHSKNHPNHRHLCESADNVDPRKAIPGGHLDIMVASPECTHHSIARGGKPIHDQSRASAWHILRWAEAIRIDRILIENVLEFQTWGPLGVNNRPLKSRRGETYRAFIQALESLGYHVETRLLVAADYGDAADAISIDEPLDAVTSKDRFALVECKYVDPATGEVRTGVKVPGTDLIVDIRFRMLQPKELARAQGFPDDYQFTGNREDRVKQIGNAVPVGLAEALCGEMIA